MIALIPAGILILAGLIVILFYQFRKGLGIPWLIAVAGSVPRGFSHSFCIGFPLYLSISWVGARSKSMQTCWVFNSI